MLGPVAKGSPHQIQMTLLTFSICHLKLFFTGQVAVVVTFFNHKSVNCKATLILDKNLQSKIQYKPK